MQDRQHAAPAIAMCRHGYDVLLEKPMAVDEESCRDIAAAAEEAGVIFSVCHVLRYMPLYEEAHKLLHGGVPGAVHARTQLGYNIDRQM